MVALILGTLLAVGALAYVLYPLFVMFRRSRSREWRRSGTAEHGGVDAVVALREIEFDRVTGKLSGGGLRGAARALYAACARGDASRSASMRSPRPRTRSRRPCRISRAHEGVRDLRTSAGAGRGVLLELRHVPAREVHFVRRARVGEGRVLLYQLRTIARCVS